MNKLMILALFLVVGATKIHGEEERQPANLTLGDFIVQPNFRELPTPEDQINGRLLTPEEGAGYVTVKKSRIVGGGPARMGEYPWMALIAYKGVPRCSKAIGCPVKGATFSCGGSLISSRHVLTAAHCTYNKPDLWFVRLGEHDVTDSVGPEQDIKIANAVHHPEYIPHILGINDLSIIYLERNAVFNDKVRPIMLPITQKLNGVNFLNTHPFVAGWGIIHEGGPQSRYLQHIQVPIIPLPHCKQAFARMGVLKSDAQVTTKHICAGAQEASTSCQGDSGGPLMLPIGNILCQIGVVSWGMPCGKGNTPTIYMNVHGYGDWINRMVGSSPDKF